MTQTSCLQSDLLCGYPLVADVVLTPFHLLVTSEHQTRGLMSDTASTSKYLRPINCVIQLQGNEICHVNVSFHTTSVNTVIFTANSIVSHVCGLDSTNTGE